MSAEQINGDSWKEKFSWINLGKENETALPDAGNYLFMLLDCENRKYGVGIENLDQSFRLTIKPSTFSWNEFQTGHAVQGVLKDLGIREDGTMPDCTPCVGFSSSVLIFDFEKNPSPDFWVTIKPAFPEYEKAGLKLSSSESNEGKLIYGFWDERGRPKPVEVNLSEAETDLFVPPYAKEIVDFYGKLPYPYRIKIMTGYVEWGMNIVYDRRVTDDPEYADERFVRYERGKRPTEYEVRRKMEEFESTKTP